MSTPIIIPIERATPSDKCYMCGRTREEFTNLFLGDIATEIQDKTTTTLTDDSYKPDISFYEFSFSTD
jgi:hypothetical protein